MLRYKIKSFKLNCSFTLMMLKPAQERQREALDKKRA